MSIDYIVHAMSESLKFANIVKMTSLFLENFTSEIYNICRRIWFLNYHQFTACSKTLNISDRHSSCIMDSTCQQFLPMPGRLNLFQRNPICHFLQLLRKNHKTITGSAHLWFIISYKDTCQSQP
jgi:hypothetical protein